MLHRRIVVATLAVGCFASFSGTTLLAADGVKATPSVVFVAPPRAPEGGIAGGGGGGGGGGGQACPLNLVPNGRFEYYTACPTGADQVYLCPPWSRPTGGSSDYFNGCAGSGVGVPGVPTNLFGSEPAHSGVGYMNFRLYGNVPPNTSTDYREYLEVPLLSPLLPGQTYQVSFWVSLAEASSEYALKDISAYFSAGPVGYVNTVVNLNLVPQFTNPGGPVTTWNGWQQITGSFVAVGGEDHMVIGNFKTDAASTSLFGGGGCCPVAVYFIDDVCVTGPLGVETGACCFPLPAGGFNCDDTGTYVECAVSGGTFLGAGTTCQDVSCAKPFTVGACCYTTPQGTPACSIMSKPQCLGLGGTYQGDGSTCSANACVPGACCYTDPQGGVSCVIVTQGVCEIMLGGTFQGAGSSCQPDPCNPMGACCYQTGPQSGFQCVVTDPTTCNTVYHGSYMGNGTSCNPSPCPGFGGCCYQIPGTGTFTCVNTYSGECALLPNSTFLGNGVLCSASTVCGSNATGACCYQGAAGPTCGVMTQAQCGALGGTYAGDNTACTPNLCTTGACCYIAPGTNFFQCVVTTQADCVQVLHGNYQGNGTSCTPDPCQPTGACCYTLPPPAIGYGCVVTTQANCEQNLDGVYQGDGSTCNPDPCPKVGACCYHDTPTTYACFVTTQINCEIGLNGTYLGDNTTCNVDSCLVGACCFTDPVQTGQPCIITSQGNCVNLGGLYQGDGTRCSDEICLLGACCYQIPGTTLWTCTQTNPTNCVQVLHGKYLGNNVPCSASECGPCYPPPPNMTGWWTLDETVGPIANDSVANDDGKYMPGPTTGPIPAAGKVQNSLWFDGVDDYVSVPPNPTLAVGASDFSVDAWINWEYYSGSINPEIVTQNGFRFRLVTGSNAPAGLLLWLTGGSGHKCVKFGVVPPGQWVHVAATYKQPTTSTSNNGVCKLYVNGVLVHTDTNGPVNNFSTNGATRIGASLTNNPGQYFRGYIDEVELFRRELSQSEIQGIITYGKCKQHCGAQWESPFCFNGSLITVNMTVCNDSPVPHSYLMSFAGIPGVPNTLCNGPLLTSFTVMGPNPVTVGPNQCVTVPVQIARPPGLTPGMHSCYTFSISNQQTGQISSCSGSVIRTNKWCWVIPDCCFTPFPTGTAVTVKLKASNTGDPDGTLSYIITMMDPEMNPDMQTVKLNGLPPGTPVKGTLTVAPGGEVEVPVEVEFTEHVPFAQFDMLVLGDEDNAGNPGEVIVSIGMWSGPHPPCVADIIFSNTVDVDDLFAVINAWGPCPDVPEPCPSDLTGDQMVDVDDLFTVINAWGQCP